jgi:hypothetical protein
MHMLVICNWDELRRGRGSSLASRAVDSFNALASD